MTGFFPPLSSHTPVFLCGLLSSKLQRQARQECEKGVLKWEELRKGMLKMKVVLLSSSFCLLPVCENILSRKNLMALSIRDIGKELWITR